MSRLTVGARRRFPVGWAVLGTLLDAFAAFVAFAVAPPAATAQERDSTVAVVQRMVNAGDRAGARQYADSVLRTVREGSSAYADALFARAFASSSAVEAERDYLRVAVEYNLSPRAEDATMMVAQLKLARSDRIGARRNFERLLREHPMGPQVPKAAFWAGRLAVEDGDLARGCQSLVLAKERARNEDVEFANQVEYYLQRCTPAALAAAAPRGGAAAATPPPSGTPPPSATRPPTPPRTAPPTKPVTSPAPPPVVDSAPPPTPPVERPVDRPVDRPLESPAERAAAPPVADRPATPTREYTVQVAAFPKQRDADALAQVLKQRGFTARVWGAAPPFRVRVGRYASREEAMDQLARMKAARLNGIVVEAEAP